MSGLTSEERELFDRSLNDCFERGSGFAERLAKARDAAGDVREPWAEYARLGWLGIAMTEEDGGAGGGQTELGILMAAAGRHLLAEPFLANLVLGAGVIELAGGQAQRTMLGEIVAGERFVAFCHLEEDGGFDRSFIETTAVAEGSGWHLTGRKTFAPGAHVADTLIVSARIGATGLVALFAVPRGTPGVNLIAAPALDGRYGAAITLDGVEVGSDALLGNEAGDHAGIIDAVLDRGVAAVCAEACGAMAAVTQMTGDYLKTRVQFGRPLSSFQVLQHRLVDMNIAAEEARAVTHAALAALDAGSDDAQALVWAAKVQVARSARHVGADGIQLHGGMGMTDELEIGHYYKRLTMCQTMFGDADWYLERLAAVSP